MPPSQTPFSTAHRFAKHISPSAITSNPLFNCPHALNTHFTQWHHLKPPVQLPPGSQNTFHPVPSPQTPFSTAPMPSIHISPIAITSNPLFNCPHALNTHFTQWNHLKPPFQLPPCPQYTFHLVPPSQTPFPTASGFAKHISPSAITSNPLFNCPHALNTHFTQCHHLKPPFLLPPMPSIHISPMAITSNHLFNCPPCPQYTFHPVPPPQTPFSTAPHALNTHFTQCHHLKPPFQLPLMP